MNKSIVFLLPAVYFFILFGAVPSFSAQKIITPTPTPKPKNIAEIEKIELDKNEVLIPCQPKEYSTNRLCGKEGGLVKVFTSLINPKNTELSYNYTVSAGKISGEGQQIIWDLNNIQPGLYSITVSISGKGSVSKETKTKEIVAKRCECNCDLSCPVLSVSGGGNVKAGETVIFTANVSGVSFDDILYEWTVSEGEIIEGQGTPKIIVKTTHEMIGNTVVATVFIKHSTFAYDCPKSDFGKAFVIK